MITLQGGDAAVLREKWERLTGRYYHVAMACNDAGLHGYVDGVWIETVKKVSEFKHPLLRLVFVPVPWWRRLFRKITWFFWEEV